MKNLVRGGIVLSILSFFVAFDYANTPGGNSPDIANNSQTQLNIDNHLSADNIENEVTNSPVSEVQDNKIKGQKEADSPASQDTDPNKSVKKTASSRAVGGVNRGTFTATAYCLRGRTASGAGVRNGIIAADPRVLPLGTRVALTGARSGSFLVADTGGKIKGKKIDIWMASCAEARRFGRRNVTISVLN